MAFWSNAGASPLRKYRFNVQGLLDEKWLVKTVTPPKFEVAQNSYQVLNHRTKVAGALSWQDVTITTVANKDTIKNLSELMNKNGHSITNGKPENSKGIVSSFEGKLKNKILIEMLDMDGKKVNTFELFDWFVASINYSDLDYSDDELFTIEVSIAYEYANIT